MINVILEGDSKITHQESHLNLTSVYCTIRLFVVTLAGIMYFGRNNVFRPKQPLSASSAVLAEASVSAEASAFWGHLFRFRHFGQNPVSVDH